MNGAYLASPIRGELGYAHWPHLGSQIHCPIGNQIWGPLGKHDVCPNFAPVFELPGGWGVEPPYLTMPTPLPLVKIRPRGVEFQPPHLSFVEVGMLLDSHFLLMQFLNYLGLHHDDLNVTTS